MSSARGLFGTRHAAIPYNQFAVQVYSLHTGVEGEGNRENAIDQTSRNWGTLRGEKGPVRSIARREPKSIRASCLFPI